MQSKQRKAKPRRPMRRGLAFAIAIAIELAAPRSYAADAGKTLRVALSIAETSFDPQSASDSIIENIYEAMLDYDYLARPVKLVPRTLEAMPVIEDGGKTYICRVRKGIFFTSDPVFKGK